MFNRLNYIVSIIGIILAGIIAERTRTGAEWINIIKAQSGHIVFIILFAIAANYIIKWIMGKK